MGKENLQRRHSPKTNVLATQGLYNAFESLLTVPWSPNLQSETNKLSTYTIES